MDSIILHITVSFRANNVIVYVFCELSLSATTAATSIFQNVGEHAIKRTAEYTGGSGWSVTSRPGAQCLDCTGFLL